MAISINSSQFLTQYSQSIAKAQKAQEPGKTLAESLAKAMPGVIKVGEKQSAEDTAKNILQFVQNGINQLKGQGASPERQQERLDAARKGIEKGYADAIDMLKGFGLYDDKLEKEIADGRKLVDNGLEQMAEQIRNPNASSTQASSIPSRLSALSVANQFSLEVMTREGDKVTVNFAQSQSGSYHNSDNGFSFSASAAQSWSMEVQGHLNEDEKKALSGLFDDVQSLSERFFAGDIGKALEQAMSIGYDGKQLASFSLNLLQRTSTTSVSPYAQQMRETAPTPELESLKSPLASYVDSYMKALEKASISLPKAPQTLQDLVERMLPTESRLPVWKSFHDGLNQLLDLSGLASQK